MALSKKLNVRLPPEVNRILFIKNLPFNISTDEMYDIFGKYGAIRQIRVGNTPETKGTAFVVYEDIFDAKNACDHLSGFNVCNRYLVVLYYQANKLNKKVSVTNKREELDKIKSKYGLGTPKAQATKTSASNNESSIGSITRLEWLLKWTLPVSVHNSLVLTLFDWDSPVTSPSNVNGIGSSGRKNQSKLN